MHVVIAGCGRVGSGLARDWWPRGGRSPIIDESPDAFHLLGDDFPGEFVVGRALDWDVLRAAGIERRRRVRRLHRRRQHEHRRGAGRPEEVRRPLRGGARLRPAARRAVRPGGHPHRVPDQGRARLAASTPSSPARSLPRRAEPCSCSSSAAARSASTPPGSCISSATRSPMVEQRRTPLRPTSPRSSARRPRLRRRHRDLGAGEGRHRPRRHGRRGDRRRRGQRHHLADREAQVRRPEGRGAGEQPVQPADLRPARRRGDGLRRRPRCCGSSCTSCRCTSSCTCSRCGARTWSWSSSRSARTRRSPTRTCRTSRCPRACCSRRSSAPATRLLARGSTEILPGDYVLCLLPRGTERELIKVFLPEEEPERLQEESELDTSEG